MKSCRCKNGIALLTTLLFIMLITVSLGVSLEYIKKSQESVQTEQFMYQSAFILEDLLLVLEKSPLLQRINSASTLSEFLLDFESIPLELNGLKVIITMQSARAKINPNIFKDEKTLNALNNFLLNRGINANYSEYIYDSIHGVREDMSYKTDMFIRYPLLFRDSISSYKHLGEINSIYMKSTHDSNFLSLNTHELFYPSSETNSSIDLNQATALTYELILGCDEVRAQELIAYDNITTLEVLSLTDDEKASLSSFNTSFYEPYLDVSIAIQEKDKTSNIRFEYNLKSKKGNNFVFEI